MHAGHAKNTFLTSSCPNFFWQPGQFLLRPLVLASTHSLQNIWQHLMMMVSILRSLQICAPHRRVSWPCKGYSATPGQAL